MKRRRIMRFRTRDEVQKYIEKRAGMREAMEEIHRLNDMFERMVEMEDLDDPMKDIPFVEAPKQIVVDSSDWTGRP